MTEWRVARSLDRLLAQINQMAPNRRKDSDGSIGDTRHQGESFSDHNPDRNDIVHARDYTHDPAGGFDSYHFAEVLRVAKDPRIKYVISNGRIFDGPSEKGHPAWSWHPYTGSNKHDHHVHVSVVADPELADSVLDWNVHAAVEASPVAGPDAPPQYVPPPPTLRKGSRGEEVRVLQRVLGTSVDGDFGPATLTALEAFQKANGLHADGVCGPMTWEQMKETQK